MGLGNTVCILIPSPRALLYTRQLMIYLANHIKKITSRFADSQNIHHQAMDQVVALKALARQWEG